ncbi:clotting factor B-like [Limulus polyphemus]|uniref:Clotting factor B-like n=1 Tax=Limulus polyphemus TaxID=6850 RepID=A0ABM1BEV2_LIMPO|nr:clotting factor B-like [Limulus polyphemus]
MTVILCLLWSLIIQNLTVTAIEISAEEIRTVLKTLKSQKAISRGLGIQPAAGFAQGSCTTAKNKRGNCKPLRDCPEVLATIREVYPTICRWQGVYPTVCCPNESVDTNVPNLQVFNCGIRPKVKTRNDFTQLSRTTPYDNRFALIGGEEVERFSWPWMTGIFIQISRNRQMFICGGSVISENYIISAAHCFEMQSPSAYSVRLGSHTLEDGNRYEVKSIKKHERYTSKQVYHDIAVLKLRRKITFTDNIRPVCLPKPSFVKQNFEGRTVVVTGWGQTSLNRTLPSKVLRQISIPIVGKKQCQDSYSSLTQDQFPRGITVGFICAGTPQGEKDSCVGDSGGPLVIEDNGSWVLLGVVAFGYKCAEPDFPGVYTSVTNYLEWIAANTELGK